MKQKKITRLFLLLILFLYSAMTILGQNINKPNKMGPMGTQVNTFTGNLFIPRNDIYVPARGLDIVVTFNYNSFNFDQDAGFGNGWSSAYSIKYKEDSADSKTVVWGNGREDNYLPLQGGGFKSPKGIFNTFTQYQPNKYLLTELNGTKFYFDNNVHKRITKMEDANGNYINFAYTDTLLISLITAVGQSIVFSYNTAGRLASVADNIASPNRSYTYSYDFNGNLAQVTDPAGATQKYSYLVNGPMKTMTDKNNNTIDIIYFNDFSISEIIGCNKRISFSYDTATNITIVTDHLATGNNQVTKYGYKTFENQVWLTSISGNCCGYNMSFEFDENGNTIKETDANGQTYSYTYDSRGNMLTMKDPLNQICTYTYSTDYNKVTSFTDPKGNTYTLSYNANGNLIQLTEPGNNTFTASYNGNGDIISSTDPKGNTWSYSFDTYGNPVAIAGPNGSQVTFAHDARGNLLSLTDAANNTHTAQYDILNRLKKITDPLNNAWQINYDAEGNAIAVINKNNETSLLHYDASNRMIKFTDAMGHQTQMSYDGMNNMVSAKNALGNGIKFSYDNRNRITSVADALNNNSNISYDANGNITAVDLPNGQRLTYIYDNINRVTRISDINGTIGSYTYDKNNNIASYTNGTGAVASGTYDNLNRLIKLTDPLGFSTQFAYDKNNKVISSTDRNGMVTNYTYDSSNRIQAYTDRNGFEITVGYDALGNVAELKDQNNSITLYTYDELNRLKTITYPDGKFLQYGYDNKGNLITKRLTDGTTINFQYDSLNRVIARILPDGEVYSYSYDAISRIISATNNTGTVTITYDELNRVASEAFDGRTTRYNYNIAGRTKTIIYPDNTVITKNYDNRNRLTSIAKNNTTLVSYQYNNANQVTVKNFGNGITSNMQYDFANRLSNISTAGGSIQNTSFTYDNERKKIAVNRLNNPALSEQFGYDNGYRLISYKRGVIGGTPTLQNAYSFDPVGNRTSANLNGINTNYTSNNLNQLTNSNNGTQHINFSYDNNGNLTYDGSFYKSYDAEGRLLKDSSSPSNVLTYQYDAFNRRVQKNFNGVPYKYSYSGLAQIEERDGITGDLIDRTVFNHFLTPVLNEKNNNSYYYHQNELNSVEAITNSSGSLAERYQYDVYGKPAIYDGSNNLITSSLAGNRFAYTGQEYDSANGNYRFHFRNYSPTTGTFNQRDLIGYTDGMGMYQYVHNNPANGIDIFGLKDCDGEKKEESAPIGATPDQVIMTTQLVVDQTGNSGFLLSVISDIPRQIAANGVRAAQANAIANLTSKGGNFGNLANAAQNLSNVERTLPGVAKVSGVVGKAGPALGAVDLGLKTATYNNVINDPNATYGDVMDAGGDVVVSGGNLVAGLGIAGAAGTGSVVAVPAAIGLGALALGDLASTYITGKSIRQHNYEWMDKQMNGDADYKNWVETFGLEDSEFLKNIYLSGRGTQYLRMIQGRKPDCPQNGGGGGTQKPKPKGPGTTKPVIAVGPKDPNEIIGPDGQPDKRWVGVKERMPYTILYENDKTASAPAKFVRVTSPIEPKQDAATFQLGNFGFNNQTFAVPPNTASYYERLDCRDSLGLYVDITAGYDQINHVAFWEFQSIDPVTLLAPADPFKGFLLMQDSNQVLFGHGFVNFSIKPHQTAVTLDTIGARAAIVFDFNDTIPTNIARNTIDAVPPTSSITDLDDYTPNTEVSLHYTGIDDPDGSGVKSYSIYVADNAGEMELYVANFKGTDTTFIGAPEHVYKFYVSATDIAGNIEPVRLLDSTRIINGEQVICPGSNLTLDSKFNSGTYQWQVDNGSGFVNISNGGVYSGANNKMLTLTAPPTSMYGYKYRCVINGAVYSQLFLLKFGMSWEGTADNSWENPANWNCGNLPDEHTDVTIGAGKLVYPQINSNVMIRSLRMQPGASGTVNSGFRLSILK